jgi:hypothetical protein
MGEYACFLESFSSAPRLHFFIFTLHVDGTHSSLSVILETDAAAIASRVSRPKPDASDIVINEETLLFAYNKVKTAVQQRVAQL